MKENIDLKATPLDYFFKATKFEAYQADQHYYLGMGCSGLDCLDEAITAFEKAVSKDRQHIKAFYQLGLHYCLKADSDNLCPVDAETARECHQKALSAFKEVIRLNPTDAEAYTELGTILDALKNHDEAIKAYKEAIWLKSADPRLRYHLVLSHLKAGDRSSATEEYNKLVSLGSGLSEELFCFIWPDKCRPSESVRNEAHLSKPVESTNHKSEQRRELP